MGEMVDLNDELVRSTVNVDDGCDWTAWIIWNMRKNYFIHNRISLRPPARPQVAKPRFEAKKKPRKRAHREQLEASDA
ncbi:MAG: hypothetical protein ACRCWW_16840 [Scandinavium sp.]|uniref:hypothetical protein n=1 Tax=Scandinavium sp. TaxID=2830653 RepID=UPI003F2D2931